MEAAAGGAPTGVETMDVRVCGEKVSEPYMFRRVDTSLTVSDFKDRLEVKGVKISPINMRLYALDEADRCIMAAPLHPDATLADALRGRRNGVYVMEHKVGDAAAAGEFLKLPQGLRGGDGALVLRARGRCEAGA